MRPSSLVEQRLLGERHADAHDDAAAELTRGRLGIDDPAAIERAEPTGHAHFAGVFVDADLAELSAVRSHRILHHLHRLGAEASTSIASCPAPLQDRWYVSPLLGSSLTEQSAVARLDLLVRRAGERRIGVPRGERQQFTMQLLDRRLHGRGDAHRLTRAAGHRRIRQRRIAVVKRHASRSARPGARRRAESAPSPCPSPFHSPRPTRALCRRRTAQHARWPGIDRRDSTPWRRPVR